MHFCISWFISNVWRCVVLPCWWLAAISLTTTSSWLHLCSSVFLCSFSSSTHCLADCSCSKVEWLSCESSSTRDSKVHTFSVSEQAETHDTVHINIQKCMHEEMVSNERERERERERWRTYFLYRLHLLMETLCSLVQPPYQLVPLSLQDWTLLD